MIRHIYTYQQPFTFESGESITNFEIVYHTSEKDWTAGDSRKVIWICHALTANSDPEDWWSDLVGKGKLFDTEKYFIICVNIPGSPYGTTSPASTNPETGQPYYFTYPAVTIRDIVKSEIIIRKALGIEKIDLLIGSSIGGFQSMEWLVSEPDVITNAVIIATSALTSPWLTAHNESMRMALESDQTFRECKSLKGGELGLQTARSIGMTFYRSREGFGLTQYETDPDFVFASRAASYQRYQGKKLSDRFDAYSYYYIVNSTDSQNIGRGRGGIEKALSTIKAKCTFIAIDSDGIFSVKEIQRMADGVPGSDMHIISSDFGHDGFLLEYQKLTKILIPILNEL